MYVSVVAALSMFCSTAQAKCNTSACKRRVEWKQYRANPMPYCTWANESGKPHWRLNPQWSGIRYRVKNPVSTASGKFQILDTTWAAFGGLRYAPSAREAYPLQQERVARRVLRGQGINAWVGCHGR